jgi:hypothetical protein
MSSWPVDVLRDLDGANDPIAFEPAAKPTADKVMWTSTVSNGTPAIFAEAAWTRAMAWLPTQTSQRFYAAPTGSLRRKPVRCAAAAVIKAASWPDRMKRAPISM